MKDYSVYLDKIVTDGIEAKCTLSDMLLGLKEVSGKLDTLISLKEVELQRNPQTPADTISHAVSQALRNQTRRE